jgi:hypothetical protein
MSGYTKLFGSILDSTVWALPHASVRVWVTLMAMADQHGEVQASVPGLTHRARVTRDECETALKSFLSPDPDSRTPDNEGRRIEPIDGGWRLINHRKYTQKLSADDRRERDTERKRRLRDKAGQGGTNRNVPNGPANPYTETQTHTQTKTEEKEKPPATPARVPQLGEPEYPEEFERFWSGIRSNRSKGTKQPALKAWVKHGKPPAEILFVKWVEYTASLGDTFAKDVSTWLNAQGWRETYEPAPKGKQTASASPYCKFHRFGRSGVKAMYPDASCPECKHLAARSKPAREGPPVDIGVLAEVMSERARELEERAERERAEHAERFNREREADGGAA